LLRTLTGKHVEDEAIAAAGGEVKEGDDKKFRGKDKYA